MEVYLLSWVNQLFKVFVGLEQMWFVDIVISCFIVTLSLRVEPIASDAFVYRRLWKLQYVKPLFNNLII